MKSIPYHIVFTLCTFALIFSCKSKEKQLVKEVKKQPNVLFIAVDDLRPQLNCYGEDYMKTPSLDKLASEGTLFTNHFVQVPTCGASRYSLLAGLYPTKGEHISNEVIVNEISNQLEKDTPETFIHHFRKNDYYTVGIGKISHYADGYVYNYNEPKSEKLELPYSWDENIFDSGKWGTGWNAFFGYSDGTNRQSRKNEVRPYEKGNVGDAGYPDGLTANLTIKKLKELKEKKVPFFLGVGFFKPHLPFTAPKKYWDLYTDNDIILSPNPDIPLYTNGLGIHENKEFNRYKKGEEQTASDKKLSDAYAKKIRHAYFASVSYVDAQIGKVLTELKRLELDNNTLVVVWGDHGWHLGDQSVWGKHTPFERSLKSALIIKVPGAKSKGQVIDYNVESVDLYPTLCQLTGLTIPQRIDGKSFAEIFDGKEMIQDNIAYSFWRNSISLRTNRYRLTQFYEVGDKTQYQLYDHQNDPNETINIANENLDVVEKLLPLLKEKDNGYLYSFKKKVE